MTYSYSKDNLKRGFTLIELVIAIAILGLIIGLVGPRVISYFSEAKITTAENQIKVLKQAINAFYLKVGEYPKLLEDLVRRPADVSAKKWREPFIGADEDENPEVPKDPWGEDYVYRLNPKGSKPPYQIYSWGPNREGSPEDEWVL